MSSNEEQIALKDLVQSEGWRAFLAFIESQWGAAATLTRIQAHIAHAGLGDQAAVTDATQHVLSAQKAVESVIRWPEERLRQLTETPAKGNWISKHRRIPA